MSRQLTSVTLVYPYFRPISDNSLFRFPPLGLGYLAASLKKNGISVDLVDCTFQRENEAIAKIRQTEPRIIGFYSMFSMKNKTFEMASRLRQDCELLIVGGPLPTYDPEGFLKHFDVVAIGEGEDTVVEIASALDNKDSFVGIRGIAYNDGRVTRISEPRPAITSLDQMPFPARELFDHDSYKKYYLSRFGYTITSMITSRGCPFACDFCSRPIFGSYFVTRSRSNIVDEMESLHSLGYERVWFADDCFTLDKKRLVTICDEIIQRDLELEWECLSRVDTIGSAVASKMKKAGCVRVFFGLESGNNRVLNLMNKGSTVEKGKTAVLAAKDAGLRVGAFFIVGYPGENDDTVLDTVRFASSLPLDYLSFTLPYPIPGTPLHRRLKDRLVIQNWDEPKDLRLIRHDLLYKTSFSEAKLKFVIVKAMVQHRLRKLLGERCLSNIFIKAFEKLTDFIFLHLR